MLKAFHPDVRHENVTFEKYTEVSEHILLTEDLEPYRTAQTYVFNVTENNTYNGEADHARNCI